MLQLKLNHLLKAYLLHRICLTLDHSKSFWEVSLNLQGVDLLLISELKSTFPYMSLLFLVGALWFTKQESVLLRWWYADIVKVVFKVSDWSGFVQHFGIYLRSVQSKWWKLLALSFEFLKFLIQTRQEWFNPLLTLMFELSPLTLHSLESLFYLFDITFD